MQEEQIPHRQNLTHCCVLIAMFGVPFFTDFLIICCLQVHLVNFGRWCGLVGSLLALVSNFWEISWCAGSHLRAFKGYGKIHLGLMLFKSQQFNMTLWAEIFKQKSDSIKFDFWIYSWKCYMLNSCSHIAFICWTLEVAIAGALVKEKNWTKRWHGNAL